MIKNQKQPPLSQRQVEFFHWRQQKKYTVLEDFVLRILEKKGGCADSEIAKILCLEESDIAIIMRYLEKEAPDAVQGGPSRRSLCDNFSWNMPDGFAIAVGKKSKFKEIANITYDQSKEITKFLNQFRDRVESGGKYEKFRQDNKAERYVLKISFYPNIEDTEFHCDGIVVPVILKYDMKKFLLPNKKSPQ